MRHFLAISSICVLALASTADEPNDAAKSRALLALQKTQRAREIVGQTPECAKALAALHQAQFARQAEPRCDCGCMQGGPCTCPDCPYCCEPYAKACEACVRDGKTLVVFVGIPARKIAGARVSHKDTLAGFDSPCVVIARPDGRGGMAGTQHPATMTPEAIGAAVSVRRQSFLQPPVNYQQYQPPPAFFGGFGGGFGGFGGGMMMGGGGGGGGC